MEGSAVNRLNVYSVRAGTSKQKLCSVSLTKFEAGAFRVLFALGTSWNHVINHVRLLEVAATLAAVGVPIWLAYNGDEQSLPRITLPDNQSA